MATTPEGAVKRAVKQLLGTYEGLYRFMPVQYGYGESSLDFIGCYRGQFFAVETKAPTKEPTARQEETIRQMERAMGSVFVVREASAEALLPLRRWLDHVKAHVPDNPRFTAPPSPRRPL